MNNIARPAQHGGKSRLSCMMQRLIHTISLLHFFTKIENFLRFKVPFSYT